MAADLKLRQRVLSRWGALKVEREPFMAQWHEISSLITPSPRALPGAEGQSERGEIPLEPHLRQYDEVVAEVEAWKESVDTETRRKMRVVCVMCGIVCFALGMGVSALLP